MKQMDKGYKKQNLQSDSEGTCDNQSMSSSTIQSLIREAYKAGIEEGRSESRRQTKRQRTDSQSSDSDSDENTTRPKGRSIKRRHNDQYDATDAVKTGLYSVKVSKHDATKFERELQGELFSKWEEKCEVVKNMGVPFKDIKGFLDHLQDAYEGIDNELRKKMDAILYTTKAWEYKIVEWKFNKGQNSGARYGMIAFGCSPDRQFVDCMIAMYTMIFKIAPEEIVTKTKHKMLWGLVGWETKSVEYRERNLGSKNIDVMKNFFRTKAMQGFYNEGVIESINYVDSLEETVSDK